jgi:hypothetical protein
LLSISKTQNYRINIIIINDSGNEINKCISFDESIIEEVSIRNTSKTGKNNAIYSILKSLKTRYFTIINDKDIVLDCLTSIIYKNPLNNEIGYVLGIYLLNRCNKQKKFKDYSSTLIEGYRNKKVIGDKLVIFRSEYALDLFTQSIFNEKYFPEDIVHLRALLKGYQYRFLDFNILQRIYLEGGITDNHFNLINNSFHSYNYYSSLTKLTQENLCDFRSCKIIIREKLLFFQNVKVPLYYLISEIITSVSSYIIYIYTKYFKK